MTLPTLDDDAIVLGATAVDWREAVRLAGRALETSGRATAAYADEMVRMIDEHGPYVVIAPGLALAHARPGPEVLADGLSIVTLDPPVDFGHPYNDPVRVVVGLAVHSVDHHLSFIADLANAFDDSATIGAIAAATAPGQVRDILGAVEDQEAGR
jgi:ascorbate PTS system EIIA or EIIAB component